MIPGLLPGFTSGLAGDIIIDSYTAATNDRFTNDLSFIAQPYDFSGVGLNGAGRWGTLVSGNVILSANHYIPAVGSDLVFHQGNDPAGETAVRTIIHGRRIGTSDLWIGILEDPVPAGYTPFSFADEIIPDANAFAESSLANATVFMLGRSPENRTPPEDMAVGLNVLNDWIEEVTAAGTTDQALIAYEDLPGDDNFLTYEALLQTGDSGGPLFRDVGGVLTLVGINWFIGETDIDPRPVFLEARKLSGFSYVGNYATAIASAIHAFSVDASAGYIAWMESAFGGETDWSLTGPAIDFDRDGVINFVEYAFLLDPASGSQPAPVAGTTLSVEGTSFSGGLVKVREDPGLQYWVRVGNDLAGWTAVPLSFDGTLWTSSDPAVVIVHEAADQGGGQWLLTLRDPVTLSPGTRRFLRVGVR